MFAPESVPLPSPPSSILHHSFDAKTNDNNRRDTLMEPSKGNDDNIHHHDFVDTKHVEHANRHGNDNDDDDDGRMKEERLVRDLLPILRPYMQCGECQQYRNELELVKAEFEALKQKYQQLQMTSIAQQAARSIQKQKRESKHLSTKTKQNTHLKPNHPSPITPKDVSSTIIPDNVISAPPNNTMTPSKSPDMSQALLESTVQNYTDAGHISHLNTTTKNKNNNDRNNTNKFQNTNDHHKRLPIDNISKKSLPHTEKQTKIIPNNQNQNRNHGKDNPPIYLVKQEEDFTPTNCGTIKEPLSVRNGDNNKRTFRYCEVVRNQEVRKTELKGYTCEECKAFFDATGMDTKELHVKDCSRHRYRFTPPSTPEGFWEMSFADERNQNDQRTSWP